MTTTKLKIAMNAAFDLHAAALKSGGKEQIEKAWFSYAKAKNAYLEAYHSDQN